MEHIGPIILRIMEKLRKDLDENETKTKENPSATAE